MQHFLQLREMRETNQGGKIMNGAAIQNPSEGRESRQVRLNVVVDPDLRSRFKASCNVRKTTMHARLTEVMRADAEAAGIAEHCPV